MRWIEVAIELPATDVEQACSLLSEIVPGGCSVEDAIQLLGPEEGFRRLPARPSTIKVYLPVDDRLGARLNDVRATITDARIEAHWIESPVDEADWANAWKAFFHVERLGRRLVIRPSWEQYQPGPDDVVIDLDPGMAFGTGQHETTRMCLTATEELVWSGMQVLDLGCGSGILGIAAALLGAKQVDALDVESVAIESTHANAVRNRVGDRLRVAEGSLDERWPFGAPPIETYDLVLANIHATAVIALAPAVFAALRGDGALVGSGIIEERLPDVVEALNAAGFEVASVRETGEWRAVVVHRPRP
ncbi:MAG: 50S ribosomal protein L11 methyltransferase [Dehalococcoidia bacterium]